ncbi:MAG: tRNA glutamyl-Q(34) synthetase GluQRS [Planctomycetota bacterium]
MPVRTTRLAPSPTGALHVGNAWSFLIAWSLARQNDWRILLRIEDLDTPRVKPGVIEQTIDTLRWLGMDWDQRAPLQSEDLAPYASAMQTLAEKGLVYPCALTRSQIADAATAPHDDRGDTAHDQRFPAELRPADRPNVFQDRATNWRFVVRSGAVPFDDRLAGSFAPDPSASVGDFVVWTKRGQPSYQLAVVVDDARQGVTDVVRGRDLIDSAARQIRLIEALGIEPRPVYAHHPLVRGTDGRRLAKRHGDTRLEHYRGLGVSPERIIALLARWAGLHGAPDRISASEFAARWSPRTMPLEDPVFTPEDDRWLRKSG